MKDSTYQELFEHMSNEHGVTLLESELQEITSIVERIDTTDFGFEVSDDEEMYTYLVNYQWREEPEPGFSVPESYEDLEHSIIISLSKPLTDVSEIRIKHHRYGYDWHFLTTKIQFIKRY